MLPFHPLFDIGLAERAELRALPPNRAIATAAARRDGVLTHAQLEALGLSKAAISRRLQRRLLFVRHRGVYAVGRFDLSRRGRLRAALLRCGRSAALSHQTAATQADLLDGRERISVTVTGTPKRPDRRSGIDLHYTVRWRPGEVVWLGGLPCTSIARTVVDLAAEGDTRAFRRAWNGADRRLLLDVGTLDEQVVRRRAGWRLVGTRLERYQQTPPTESELEDTYLDLGDAHGLDRQKDLELREAGFDPHRCTWWQVRDQGPRVIAAVARALAQRS